MSKLAWGRHQTILVSSTSGDARWRLFRSVKGGFQPLPARIMVAAPIPDAPAERHCLARNRRRREPGIRACLRLVAAEPRVDEQSQFVEA